MLEWRRSIPECNCTCITCDRQDRDTEIYLCRLHAAAPDMLHRLKQAAAVLRWYATTCGNAGGAEYEIQDIDALVAKIEETRGHA